jgi:hypothetical protein
MPSISMPSSPHPNERSVLSLESEIMRLQEVLKDREAEILVLEDSLKAKHHNGSGVNGLVNGDATSAKLSSTNWNQFDDVHKSLGNGHQSELTSESDDSLDRLNELMLYVFMPLFGIFVAYWILLDLWLKRSRTIERS